MITKPIKFSAAIGERQRYCRMALPSSLPSQLWPSTQIQTDKIYAATYKSLGSHLWGVSMHASTSSKWAMIAVIISFISSDAQPTGNLSWWTLREMCRFNFFAFLMPFLPPPTHAQPRTCKNDVTRRRIRVCITSLKKEMWSNSICQVLQWATSTVQANFYAGFAKYCSLSRLQSKYSIVSTFWSQRFGGAFTPRFGYATIGSKVLVVFLQVAGEKSFVVRALVFFVLRQPFLKDPTTRLLLFLEPVWSIDN